MTQRDCVLVCFLLFLWSPILAQEVAPGSPRRIAIIGASLSGGFNAAATDGSEAAIFNLVRPELQIKRGLEILWPEPQFQIKDFSRITLFRDPNSGFRQLKSAKAFRPEVLIALDFPFWFGYGRPPSDLFDSDERLAWRFRQQEKLFAALDEWTIPIVIGDYPDLTDADRRMIPSSMIPPPHIIQSLNSRLHAFAALRPHLHLVPLASHFHRLRSGAYEITEQSGLKFRVPAAKALQWDRMHPTPLGMALLHHALGQHFQRLPWPPELRPRQKTIDDFAAVSAATKDLEELRRETAKTDR